MLSFCSSEEEKPEKLLTVNLNITELFGKICLIHQVLKSQYPKKPADNWLIMRSEIQINLLLMKTGDTVIKVLKIHFMHISFAS